MGTTVRESIIQNIKTTLEAITIANGYNATIAKVVQWNPNGIGHGTMPMIIIAAGPEPNSENEGYDLQTCRMTVFLDLWIAVDEDATEAADTTLNKHLGDIKKALMTDLTRGGYAVTTHITDVEPFDVVEGQPYAGLIITAEVHYRHAISNPETAG